MRCSPVLESDRMAAPAAVMDTAKSWPLSAAWSWETDGGGGGGGGDFALDSEECTANAGRIATSKIACAMAVLAIPLVARTTAAKPSAAGRCRYVIIRSQVVLFMGA